MLSGMQGSEHIHPNKYSVLSELQPKDHAIVAFE